ncbi:hypothetical protein HDV03_003370 [Kappamyces sp. JEL0829]|nr:hypothetical protein HDV03_003370 [Kappamyces sp. JEL0829]
MDVKKRAFAAIKDTSSWFGLLGNAPNYMLGAEEFNTAAATFKSLGNWEEAVDCYIQSAKCHAHSDAHYLEAKQYEAAALLLEKNVQAFDRAAATFKLAADACLAAGSPDKTVELLGKGARCLETSNATLALSFYHEAVSVLEQEERQRFGIEIYTKCIAFCLRSKLLDEALAMSSKLETVYGALGNATLYHRQVVTSILMLLALHDEDNAFERWNQASLQSALATSEEGEAIQTFIQAFATCQQPEFDAALESCKMLMYMDPEVVRMAKAIKVPEESSKTRYDAAASLRDQIEEEGYL